MNKKTSQTFLKDYITFSISVPPQMMKQQEQNFFKMYVIQNPDNWLMKIIAKNCASGIIELLLNFYLFQSDY